MDQDADGEGGIEGEGGGSDMFSHMLAAAGELAQVTLDRDN